MSSRILYTKQHRSRKSRRKTALVVIFSLIVLILFVNLMPLVEKKEEVQGLNVVVPPPIILGEKNSSGIGYAVQDALIGTKGNYGVVVKDLGTGEFYEENEHKQFESGSLYKLWVMGEAYRQIKDGKLKEDQIISHDVGALNKKFNIASESAERTEGRVSMTVADAIERMVIISDNYSALILTEKVGISNVAKFLLSNGLTESAIGTGNKNPITTPHDIAVFFQKIYKGELVDKFYSEKMLTLLKRQRLNEKIPAKLPEDILVAHKTGELTSFSHDGGIVFTENSDYVLVVLSQSDAPDLANLRISNLSKNVFDYFNLSE